MKWTRVLERHGYEVQQEEGTDIDPFLWLAQQAQARGEPVAQVSYRTSLDFAKAACTVTISCPQDERSINVAGELVFRKAHELTNDGAAIIGEPPLQGPSE
jgi:hypothetical protein